MYRLACRGSYSLHGRERPCGAITARDNTRTMSRLAGPRLAVLLVVCASCGGASSSSGNDAPGSDGSSNPFAFCYDSQIVDLSVSGTRTSSAIEYRGSNAAIH